MPYITDDERRCLLANGIAVAKNTPELAFKIAVDVDDYFIDKTVSFTTLTDALTALESVYDEINRRFLHAHEDRKIAENGDVFSNLKAGMPTRTTPPPYDWEQDD